MKKTLLTLLLCLLSLTVLVACFGGGSTTNQGTGNAGGSSGGNQSQNQSQNGGSSNLGDYNVVIKSCRLTTDYDGESVVIITYDFTNNSDDEASFDFTISDKVYQNGISLSHAYLVEDDSYDSENSSRSIKSGITITVEEAYVLSSTTADVEVELSELISFSSKKVTKTFKLN